MALVELNARRPHGLNVFADLRVALTNWRETRATRKALSQLTDRELNDIGLNRADVDMMRLPVRG